MFTLVGTASNDKKAIDIFEELKPDVLTMDLTIPEMDGIECISSILKLTRM